ncbi:uncharacterized protein LOC108863691 [Galendromus occidentalis]|uniref:Uncharacterized protein LOC108863691 n=1 Tax=Galendromus occidentalis TaxID=34638 RepID=A0AAJ7L2K2_9ACAR|nr:uncharacterized protein LOC108863691 [Galendromus occidentalis]
MTTISNWPPRKSEAVMLVRRRNDEGPDIRLMGEKIEIKAHTKYLGLILERNLTWKMHLEITLTKAAQVATSMAKILPRTYGAGEIQRRMMATVAESIVMYGAPIRAPTAMKFQKYKNLMEKTQRIMAIRTTRAYKTISTDAVLVLNDALEPPGNGTDAVVRREDKRRTPGCPQQRSMGAPKR